MDKLIERKAAELSLIFAVPLLTNAKEHSRLAGLQRELQKTVKPYLKILNSLTQSEISVITKRIDDWGETVGWWNDEAPVGALISFCLDIVEYSTIPYDLKIMEILVWIAEHLEQGNALEFSSCVNAAMAAEEWKKRYA